LRGGVASEVIWPAVGPVKRSWSGWPKVDAIEKIENNPTDKGRRDELLKIMLSSPQRGHSTIKIAPLRMNTGAAAERPTRFDLIRCRFHE
jgi:hypothetical protein